MEQNETSKISNRSFFNQWLRLSPWLNPSNSFSFGIYNRIPAIFLCFFWGGYGYRDKTTSL